MRKRRLARSIEWEAWARWVQSHAFSFALVFGVLEPLAIVAMLYWVPVSDGVAAVIVTLMTLFLLAALHVVYEDDYRRSWYKTARRHLDVERRKRVLT